MKANKNFILFFVFLVIIVPVCSVFYLNYKGVCMCELRTVGDEEKLTRAIESLMNNYPPAIFFDKTEEKSAKIKRPEQPIPYQGVDDFLSKNKDCCKLVKIRNIDEGENVFSKKIQGVGLFFTAKYKVFYREGLVVKSSEHYESWKITNCGLLIND